MNVEIFGEWCVFGTIIIVLLKTSAAGFLCGVVYRLLKKKNVVAAIVASVFVPIVNTGLFILGALIFYRFDFNAIFSIVISFNFLIELGSTILLSPAVIRIIEYSKGEQNEA